MPESPDDTASPAGRSTDQFRVRSDLGVVRYPDEVVVFDPLDRRTHVLGGGAALVWRALETGGTGEALADLADLAHSLDVPSAESAQSADGIADQVHHVIARLTDLGLLTAEP